MFMRHSSAAFVCTTEETCWIVGDGSSTFKLWVLMLEHGICQCHAVIAVPWLPVCGHGEARYRHSGKGHVSSGGVAIILSHSLPSGDAFKGLASVLLTVLVIGSCRYLWILLGLVTNGVL